MKKYLPHLFIISAIVITLQCTSTIVYIKAKGEADIESGFNKDVRIELDSVEMLNWKPDRGGVRLFSDEQTDTIIKE